MKKTSSIIISFLVFFLPVSNAFAYGDVGVPNFLKANDFAQLVDKVAGYIFMIGMPIAVIMILYGGLLFLTSSGNEEKVKKAKRALTYAMIGVAILLIGKGFISLLASILGAK